MNNTSCYFCGEPSQLEQHHIVPRRFDGSDKDENLVRVCPTCHEKLESLYDKRFYDELGVEKPDAGDKDIIGWCAHKDCYADAEHKVTGADTYIFCSKHFTCNYSRCDNQPVDVLPTPEGENGVCVCKKHRTCNYRDCQSEDTGLYRIELGRWSDEAEIRCRHHPLDETTTFNDFDANRPEWEGSAQH